MKSEQKAKIIGMMINSITIIILTSIVLAKSPSKISFTSENPKLEFSCEFNRKEK